MARRRRRTTVLETAGESVGRALGRLAARLSVLDQQRARVAAEISRVARGITGSGSNGAGAVTGGVGRRRGGRPKGFKISAATRRKLRAAWKRRKAAAAGKTS